ncbi:hypothetical protein GOBAR_DD19264 [Gossypium barbadense]|nr:hypothetical protein GOBAR_DD19264 [Gossypium barbadense]
MFPGGESVAGGSGRSNDFSVEIIGSVLAPPSPSGILPLVVLVPSGCGAPSFVVPSAPLLFDWLGVLLDGSMLLASNCRAALLFINSPCCNRTQGVRSGSCAAYLSQMELWMCCRPFSIPCPSGCVVDLNRALCPECAPLNRRGLVGALVLDRAFGCGKFKKLVLGLRGGSVGPPHGEHRSARHYCRRCAPGLNWPGHSSSAVTLKKLETPPAPYEKSKSLGSRGSMVARLKLKGIDRRAPLGVEPATKFYSTRGNLPDLKDGDLCLSGAKPEETMVEARSDTDVQIVRLTWV